MHRIPNGPFYNDVDRKTCTHTHERTVHINIDKQQKKYAGNFPFHANLRLLLLLFRFHCSGRFARTDEDKHIHIICGVTDKNSEGKALPAFIRGLPKHVHKIVRFVSFVIILK